MAWRQPWTMDGYTFRIQCQSPHIELVIDVESGETGKLIDAHNPLIWDALRWARENAEEMKLIGDIHNNGLDYYIFHGHQPSNKILSHIREDEASMHMLETVSHSQFTHQHIRDQAAEILGQIQNLPPATKREDKPKQCKKEGYVYLLEAGPYYKIGVAKNVAKRVRQLSALPPFDLKVLHTIWAENSYGLEAELHERFADKRKNGEWFILDKADIEYIKSIKGASQ